MCNRPWPPACSGKRCSETSPPGGCGCGRGLVVGSGQYASVKCLSGLCSHRAYRAQHHAIYRYSYYTILYYSIYIASLPGPDQLSVAFPYYKQWKAGWGLGTRLLYAYYCVPYHTTVNWEIFVIWNFHWKNFRRVVVLQKYWGCIWGYHAYKEVWEAVVGKSLVCKRARKRFRSIRCDCEKGTVIRYLPRKVSRVRSVFLRRGGTIECTVTGRRKYSADLAQGVLEVSCPLLFKAMLMEPVGSESPLLGRK